MERAMRAHLFVSFEMIATAPTMEFTTPTEYHDRCTQLNLMRPASRLYWLIRTETRNAYSRVTSSDKRMTTLGGWWMASYPLPEDEALLEKYPANYFASEGRPLGGRLYLTDQRVVFLPHRLDSLLGGSSTDIPFESINGIYRETAADRDNPESPIPDRLEIQELSGESHLFVLSDLDGALLRTRELLGIETEEETLD